MSRLDGRIIIVTGSTQGVGAAIATHCAEQGAAGVVICGRNEENGRAVAGAIEQCPVGGEFVRADFEHVEDCREVVRRCDERFGRVDGLVNGAAITTRGTLGMTKTAGLSPLSVSSCGQTSCGGLPAGGAPLRREVRSSDGLVKPHRETSVVWDQLFVTQEVVRIMRRERISGSIVNILSITKYCGPDFICAYSSSKGALATFTKNIANHLLTDRIRVNGINLGWTDTPNEHAAQVGMGQPENWLEHAERVSPFGRLIKPIDVARLAVFLLSEDSGVMTGALIDQAQRVIGAVTTPRAGEDD